MNYQKLKIKPVADLILDVQKENGEIPWSQGGQTDPWDHVEAAMGLSIAGHAVHAKRAFKWLAHNQLEDGAWYAEYQDGIPTNQRRDANMSTYIAVGALHYYLITHDLNFLKNLWENIDAAINFAIRLQAPGGEIHWAIMPDGKIDQMALLTGSSSICMSIKCGLTIADLLGHQRLDWEIAFVKLSRAIKLKPTSFNMTKNRYSMDWFYPILCGAVTGIQAHERIEKYWKKFIIEGQGIRCVSDQPWITIAETSEFCLTLIAMGRKDTARMIFNWISDKYFKDQSYWCGYTFPDMVVWPEEKMTWTNAVVLMAMDSLENLTSAAQIFNHSNHPLWVPAGLMN